MSDDERLELAKARASALALNSTAVAGGLLPRTQPVFDAVANLSVALALDLWTLAA